MITSSKEDIPEFIKKSDLYQVINNDEDITYPKQYSPFKIIKPDTFEMKNIYTFDNLTSVFHIMRYWMVNDTPFEVYKYIRNHGHNLNSDQINYLKNEFRDIKCLDEILLLLDFPSSKNCNIPYIGYIDYIYTRKLKKEEYRNGIGYNYKEYYSVVRLVNQVVKMGYLNLLKYLYEEEKYDGWDFMAYNIAAEHGYLDILQYLIKYKCPKTIPDGIYDLQAKPCELAAGNGHLECLKILHENKFEWDYKVIVKAAQNDHFDCVKYSCENGCKFVDRQRYNACTGLILFSSGGACCRDNLKMLKYVIARGAPWDRNTLGCAIHANSPKCLKYLVSIGGTIDGNMTAFAGGNLEILKYLNENNFNVKWSENPYRVAARTSLECFKYLLEDVCTLPIGEKCKGKCQHNNMDKENIYSDTLFECLKDWKNKDVYNYLFDKGLRFSQNNYGSCIYNGQYEIMKHMYDIDIKEKDCSELSKLTIYNHSSESFIVRNMPNEDGVHKRISRSWSCGYKHNKGDLKSCYELAKKAGCKVTSDP